MKKLFKSKKRITELVLIAALLVLSAVLYFVLNGGTPGAAVIVRVKGAEIASYPLSADGSYPLNGGTNTLVIARGQAYLTQCDCPDKLCEKQGKIHFAGQCITCLPNRLTVTVIGAESSGIDAMT